MNSAQSFMYWTGAIVRRILPVKPCVDTREDDMKRICLISRNVRLAEVPTLAEAGIADADYPFWYGLFFPAKTPRDIVDRGLM